MKKIIATVLAMVMALALCSTAFAATEVTAAAYRKTNAAAAVPTAPGFKATFHAATAAKTNSDGEQINTANVAYYTTNDTNLAANYIVVGSLAEADVVLYSDAAAKNPILYLAESFAEYDGTGTVFTKFGKSCGELDETYDTTATYYTTNDEGDKTIYVTATTDATKALMVGGKLVDVKASGWTTSDLKAHSAVPTIGADGKITAWTCATCKLAAVKAPNLASVPAGITPIAGTGTEVWYFPAAAASTTTTTSSPKTFDAGIAMYVGMALTSVAGSAVVIGKKKEF